LEILFLEGIVGAYSESLFLIMGNKDVCEEKIIQK
jgi:hypothetical protein